LCLVADIDSALVDETFARAARISHEQEFDFSNIFRTNHGS
jgi:hypothetical protein